MNSNTNSKMEAETAEATFCPVAYATVFKEGWERVVKASKTSLDFAIENNSEMLASYQSVMKVPGPCLFDLADRALKGYVTLQKNLLDLSVEQSTEAVKAAEEHSNGCSKASAGIILQSLDSTEAAETQVLNPAAQQTERLDDTGKQQPGLASAPVQTDTDPDAIQLRMLAKEIVDLATLPAAKSTVQ